MKKKIKIVFCLVILIILLVTIIICVRGKNNNHNDNSIENISNIETMTNLNTTKKIGNLEFSNIKIEKISEDECEFRAEVYNSSDEIIESKIIKVNAFDKSGELNEIFGVQMGSIMPEGTITMVGVIRKDITGAQDVKLEIQ